MDGSLFGVCNMAGSLSGAGNTAGSLFGVGITDGSLLVIVKFAVAFPLFDTISIVCSPIGSVAI